MTTYYPIVLETETSGAVSAYTTWPLANSSWAICGEF